MAVAGQSARATTVLVDPADMGQWSFANASSSGLVGANLYGSGSMVVGPATPPLGIGSANLATGNGTNGGNGAEILSSTGYALTPLSSLTALSYSTYVTSNNGSQFPYLELEIEGTIGGVVNYDQLFFEPPYQTAPYTTHPSLPDQGAEVLNTWQTWNALEGGWWDNAGICSPGAFESAFEPGCQHACRLYQRADRSGNRQRMGLRHNPVLLRPVWRRGC